MGTRCITEIRSRWEGKEEYKQLAVIYRHWDGYLSGHGQDLFNFLDSVKIINGIRGNEKGRFANGPGRLAAMLVYDLHKDGHNPDLIGSVQDCGQEYHYVIDVDYGREGGTVSITVYDGPMTAFGLGGEDCTNKIFNGSIKEYGEFIKKEED